MNFEKQSGLKFNSDFYCGYSPERINPGDKKHKLIDIKKVIAGSTQEITLEVDKLYKEIILAGTHIAKNIKVAEAAKVIENTQRDLNIALVNELAIIFKKMNIDTEAVLEAAGTKWNFLPFKPGLVGGHCIGVDPYYLAEKARKLNISPQVILSGRDTNDGMIKFVGKQICNQIPKKSKVLFLGITFKEDVPDLRNSKSIELIKYLEDKKHNVFFYDPFIKDMKKIKRYEIQTNTKSVFDAIVLTVPNMKLVKDFKKRIYPLLKVNGVLFDLKAKFRGDYDKNYWSL